MSDDVNVREADRSDIDRIVALMGNLAGEETTPVTSEQAQAILEEIDGSSSFALTVAELNGSIVGSAFFAVLPDFPYGGRPYAHVDNVVVDKAHQGLGVGTALLDDAIARARKAGCWGVQLTSRSKRTGAHAFYENKGFRSNGVGFTKILH